MNPDFNYPMCEEYFDFSLFDDDEIKEKSMTLSASTLEELISHKKSLDECLFNNYPKDLNRLEFMNFVEDFHIAEFYTVNHNMPNLISFKPRSEGIIKLLI